MKSEPFIRIPATLPRRLNAHEMNQRGYDVRIDEDRVSVEHRASPRPRTTAILTLAYLGYCQLPAIRRVLADFYHSHDPIIGGFALVLLLIPFLFGITWLFFASGEVMNCDTKELHFAKRRTFGRWHRFRFPSSQIRELHRASRGNPKSRNYTVLTFQYKGRTFDMLEDLSRTDSDRVLLACKSMGVDTVIALDPGEAMLKDIDQRGWFINPLRSDGDQNPSETH
jgi:hypothetical protein